MSVQRPSLQYPTPMEWARYCRNGRAPSSLLGQRVLAAYSHAVAYRRKTFFAKSMHLDTLPAGQNATLTPWRTYVRTGYAASGSLKLWFQTVAAPADNTGAEPTIQWKESGGEATELFYQGVNTGTLGPDDLRVHYGTIDVSANTAYELEMETTNYARPVSATIFELHDGIHASGDTGVVQRELVSVGGLITDAQHSQMLQTGHDLWLGNAAPAIAWCTDEDPDNSGTAPQRSTASYANIFDQTVTTVTSTSRGFYPCVQFHNPYHSSNVECVFAAYGKNASSAGGDVRLLDADGALATLSSFSTAGEWKTTAVNLDGSLHRHKVDVHFQGDGSNTFTLYALVVYEYAT